jgi:aminopeptidase YwaD
MIATAEAYLDKLCRDIPGRATGSPGNRAATDFFAATIGRFGFDVTTQDFDCYDWTAEGATLTAGPEAYTVYPSPLSLGVAVSAPLAVAGTMDELAAVEADGRLLLLRGELAAEQLTPKNYPFYQVEAHQDIIRLLEAQRPAAILTATGRNPELAGAVYPFPLIEDGDFDIPSVYLTDVEGDRLARRAGQTAALHSRARRIPAQGSNVIARVGMDPARRVVVMAHIDAKAPAGTGATPGALDNASGVAILLLLAELLRDYRGALTVEIAAINGEDTYSAPGEMAYLAHNDGRLDEIVLGINLDGVGYRQGRTAWSLYDCPEPLAATIRETLKPRRGMMAGKPWYQGDHMLLVMNDRPALAFTSAEVFKLLATVIHTPGDTPDLVDPALLVETAEAVGDVILALDALPDHSR